MLADVYDCPVKTVVSKEGGALGVAILAGVGAGIYKSVQEACDTMIKYGDPQAPDKAAGAEYEKFYSVYKGLYPQLKESFGVLASL
jgi:xylulokinase